MSVAAGQFWGALKRLIDKGVRCSTVVDVGCADGHFALELISSGLLPAIVPVNVDANSIYGDSLKAIAEVVGGYYRIAAVTDREGEIEITQAAHPYWNSVRPESDLYWQRLNRMSGDKVQVPATTLDILSKQLDLKPPFLLKLDVQGGEVGALTGAAEFLKNTHIVICEADMDDFQAINAILLKNNFLLYDATDLQRLSDGSLGWFYPVYVNKALDFVLPKGFWSSVDNQAVISLQISRRASVLKSNAEKLARIRAAKAVHQLAGSVQPAAPIGRNELCPCGSGRRYKHCCGALQ